jgi:hypothetical protein
MGFSFSVPSATSTPATSSFSGDMTSGGIKVRA